ncbi:Rha family transcriptional regulator [Edwardsiella piscicida]
MTHQLSVHTPSVIIRNHRPITTSIAVAEFFGKQHKNVIQKIETLDCSPDFASANFSADVQSVSIGNSAKRESKIYEMTKDGFVFLVMGFTGKKAAAFKEAYIAAFNRMEAQVLHQRPEQIGYLGRSHKNISREDRRLQHQCTVSALSGDFLSMAGSDISRPAPGRVTDCRKAV